MITSEKEVREVLLKACKDKVIDTICTNYVLTCIYDKTITHTNNECKGSRVLFNFGLSIAAIQNKDFYVSGFLLGKIIMGLYRVKKWKKAKHINVTSDIGIEAYLSEEMDEEIRIRCTFLAEINN